MAAGYVNLQIEAGSTFSVEIELDNADGTPTNLTGYTGSCKMRKSYYSNFDVYDLTVTILTPETDGKFRLSASSTTTATFKPGRYVYDVEITSGGEVKRVIEGIIVVKPNATR